MKINIQISLVIAQRVPLHRYPMHALETLSALYPTTEQEDMTLKLVSLSQAHSRFILLLQSLVHSSHIPTYQEPEEYRSRLGLMKTGLRELTFPTPLSLFPEIERQTVPDIDSLPSFRSHGRHGSASSRLGIFNLSPKSSSSPSTPKKSKSEASVILSGPSTTPSRKGFRRRVSLFRTNSKVTPPPPPSFEPNSLKFYGASWRNRRTASQAPSLSFFASTEDEDSPLEPPHRRFASANNSSASSLSPPGTPNWRESLGSSIRSSSPHDLQLALSRTRAPVLRVFVPCTEMDDTMIIACEEQLEDAGLWSHLSTGDIICNLGFVPPTPTDSGSNIDESSTPSEPGLDANRKWLLFNGYTLVPFTPPEPPAVDDPLTLPTPFYYAHILSPFHNQRYNLRLPPSDFDELPQLTLVFSSTKVKSPHSPSGYAMVKKYMWVAKVTRFARTNLARFGEGEAIGDGWKGEWVLEGEGTIEGRQILIDCIRGCETAKREWEFVREKSGGGRIWLK